jgi:Protein of unknown function (DUF1161)
VRTPRLCASALAAACGKNSDFNKKEEDMSPSRMALSALVPLALAAASTAAKADSCEALKTSIEARIRSNGLVGFTLTAVDVAASAPGRVVGNCAGGARKILMTGGVAGAPGVSGVSSNSGSPAAATVVGAATRPAATTANTAAARPKPADNILTECNDGTMSVGGTCKK